MFNTDITYQFTSKSVEYFQIFNFRRDSRHIHTESCGLAVNTRHDACWFLQSPQTNVCIVLLNKPRALRPYINLSFDYNPAIRCYIRWTDKKRRRIRQESINQKAVYVSHVYFTHFAEMCKAEST
jgi:hypothetical protein